MRKHMCLLPHQELKVYMRKSQMSISWKLHVASPKAIKFIYLYSNVSWQIWGRAYEPYPLLLLFFVRNGEFVCHLIINYIHTFARYTPKIKGKSCANLIRADLLTTTELYKLKQRYIISWSHTLKFSAANETRGWFRVSWDVDELKETKIILMNFFFILKSIFNWVSCNLEL